MCPIFYLIRF
ncbi:hypothetical protein BpHYR1_030229 [Brachionus plicatilis]|uniref:Uncharacterized protein n=1 Tax=Brachionus plicatilis TaxID=10195 RepID=A0A3M7PEE4_BRAPC|nr:hypothetical protein BpHYR1_030229 [Brachionus plicatilis]